MPLHHYHTHIAVLTLAMMASNLTLPSWLSRTQALQHSCIKRCYTFLFCETTLMSSLHLTANILMEALSPPMTCCMCWLNAYIPIRIGICTKISIRKTYLNICMYLYHLPAQYGHEYMSVISIVGRYNNTSILVLVLTQWHHASQNLFTSSCYVN